MDKSTDSGNSFCLQESIRKINQSFVQKFVRTAIFKLCAVSVIRANVNCVGRSESRSHGVGKKRKKMSSSKEISGGMSFNAQLKRYS